MAGSLNHIVSEDGRYYLDHIENMRDANEALEECFSLIFYLAKGDRLVVSNACRALGFPDPWEDSREGDTFVALAKPYYDERAAIVLAAPGGKWEGPNYTHPPADTAIERAEVFDANQVRFNASGEKPKEREGDGEFERRISSTGPVYRDRPAAFSGTEWFIHSATGMPLELYAPGGLHVATLTKAGEDPDLIGTMLKRLSAVDPDFAEAEPGTVTLDDLDSVVPKGSVADIANMLTGRVLTESAAAYIAVYVVGLER